jgi:copper transport protein
LRGGIHSPARRTIARACALVASIGLALLLATPPASAHPVVLFTDPALDTAVTQSPTAVTIVFNEAVTASADGISVTDLNDREIPVGQARTAKKGTVVTASFTDELPRGTYRVHWEAVGVDGHGVDGEFRFAVGSVVSGAETASNAQRTDWPAAVVRWLLLAGFALAAGGLVGERMTATTRMENLALPRPRAWSDGAAGLGLLAAVAGGALLVADLGSPSQLWQSGPGRVVLADTAGFAAALVVMRTKHRLWSTLPLGVIAVAEGTASHANVETPVIGAVLTGIHMAAAALWVGALLHVARTVVRWRAWRHAVRWLVLSYARMAAWVFAAVVATGTIMAVLLVPLPALTGTSYGTMLLVKLGLVAVATALALLGRWALRHLRLGRLSRTVRAESFTLVVVLAATAALVSTPTPGGTGQELPPPPPRGVAVPAGGLAGQVGVNVVASESQVVVRLFTPRVGDEYEPRESTDFEISAHLEPPEGTPEEVRFRSCGGGCFVAPVTWRDGDNVLSLRVDAAGWRGGTYATLIPWPAQRADDLVERTVRVMQQLDEFTMYEAGTSNAAAGLPEPTELTVNGEIFLSNEPYNSGVAPIAAVAEDDSGRKRLMVGFPASGVHADLVLDGLGRVTQETLTGPKHVFQRRFLYPEE